MAALVLVDGYQFAILVRHTEFWGGVSDIRHLMLLIITRVDRLGSWCRWLWHLIKDEVYDHSATLVASYQRN